MQEALAQINYISYFEKNYYVLSKKDVILKNESEFELNELGEVFVKCLEAKIIEKNQKQFKESNSSVFELPEAKLHKTNSSIMFKTLYEYFRILTEVLQKYEGLISFGVDDKISEITALIDENDDKLNDKINKNLCDKYNSLVDIVKNKIKENNMVNNDE